MSKNGNSLRVKAAAAYATALLPKGYAGTGGFNRQENFVEALKRYPDQIDAACSILQAVSLANITDNNRRSGPGQVLQNFHTNMEFITGKDTTGQKLQSVGVVSVGKGVISGKKDVEPSISVIT